MDGARHDRVAGEVRFPGKYPIHQGETLHSVLQRAGGFTDTAFPEGAVFIREDLKKREKDQLELLANRLQSDLAALSLEAVASSAVTNGRAAAAAPRAKGCRSDNSCWPSCARRSRWVVS